ncbi:DUF362 domain-containing protein, partial [Chloroflexota bacterium]
LIKPSASYSAPYPVTTTPEIILTIIEGIRRVSDADILILEGTPNGDSIYPIYKALCYDFPRVLMLDVRDCIWVEVDNPLSKSLLMPSFWVPNVILSSDYLITVAPLKIINDQSSLSIKNLLSILPSSKYVSKAPTSWGDLCSLGMDQVIADLYFTLPFDLGIIEAHQKFISQGDPILGNIEEYGKVFIGEPYEVDCETSGILGLKTRYLDLIKASRLEFET